MRLQVVLYVAVFLCVLKFAAGATCINGVELYASGQCVCPSGLSGADCNTNATTSCDPMKTTAPPTQAERFPTLGPNAAFTLNTLRVSVVGPYVKDRQYTGIHFIGSQRDECSLGSPNSFWSTSFADASVCEDIFNINMPWVNHTACGFAKYNESGSAVNDTGHEDDQSWISANHYVTYMAKFTVYYVDNLGGIDGFMLTRNTSVPYQIFVQFPTQLDVSLTNVKVQSVVDMGIALTMDSYDPDTTELTLEITVINSWPNMLSINDGNWKVPVVPAPVHWINNDDRAGSVVLPLTATNNGLCSEDEGSNCQQSYQFKFNTSVCTYDGEYNFTAPLYTCRGDYYTWCTFSTFVLTFDLSTSTICSNITVEPPLVGTLRPYHQFSQALLDADSDNSNVMPFTQEATDGFNIGQYGYFQIQLDANTRNAGNDIYLKIFEVSFTSNIVGDTNPHYLVKNGSIMNDYVVGSDQYHYDEARFQFMDRDNGTAGFNYENVKAFKLYFSSVVFKVNPTMSQIYTFRASAYATFAGNKGETDQGQKKRVVDFVWEATADQMKTFVKVPLKEAGTPVVRPQEPIPAPSNLAYIVGGAAAGLVAVAAAVFAVVRSKKNSYKTLAETRA